MYFFKKISAICDDANNVFDPYNVLRTELQYY